MAENNYNLKFDKENNIKFIDYNPEYFSQFSFKDHSDKLGYNAKLCDFETYVRICKETGKIVYATLRINI